MPAFFCYRSKNSVLTLLGIAGTLAFGVLGCGRSEPSSVRGDASNPIEVRTFPVATEVVRRNVQAVGSLYAWDESTVSTEVEGRADRVLVDVGDSVKEGQVLVELDPVELQYQLDSQRAAVRQVRAQLGIGPNDPPPADPSRVAFVQRAAADLSDAEQKFRRAQEMYRASLIPQQQLDEAGTRLQGMKAAYNVSLQDVDRFKAQLQSSEAAANLAQKRLSETSIRAPYQGAVKTRSVSPGEYLKAQSAVMVIVRTDKLRARLQVPERWAGSVKVGATVDVRVEAFPGEVFRGQIQRINPAVTQDSRTFDVEALIQNPSGRLKPGFFLQASMPSTVEEKTLTVPEQAVTYRYGVYKVFIVNGPRVAERSIKPGLQTDDGGVRKIEIVEGLIAGDRVAVAVQGDLRDGATVRDQGHSSEAGGSK
jgi:membrane fusion protein, multidrug efflux system